MLNVSAASRNNGQTQEMSAVRSHVTFASILLISILAFSKSIWKLIAFSLDHDYSSHILLIPFISAFFLYFYKDKIFRHTRFCLAAGIPLILAGTVFFLIVKRSWSSYTESDQMSATALSLVLVLIGTFILCYGYSAAREAAFPLLFLLLMIPLPDAFLTRIIYWLQAGSTEISFLLFKVTGTPVLRHGFFLAVPGYTIEVAQECSSIRSSVALLITCILAAQVLLRNPVHRAILVALSIPLSIVKNGIRITTLTLLSIHVNPGFLTGRLHKEGGFVFFLAALAILWPFLLILQKSEISKDLRRANSGEATEIQNGSEKQNQTRSE
jgi:exosortase